MKTNDTKLFAWLRLLRLPNLLTVPGDPIAGFFLAMAPFPGEAFSLKRMLFASGASLCIYAYGLVMNDLLDVAEDSKERPFRPIPSGKISIAEARIFAVVLALAGLNFANLCNRETLYCAVALVISALAYNAILKRLPVVGVLAMGVCRGLSVLVGAFAAVPQMPNAQVFTAAAIIALFTAAFSQVARHETAKEKGEPKARFFPLWIVLLALPTLVFATRGNIHSPTFAGPAMALLLAIAIMRSYSLAVPLWKLLSVPEIVGGHICCLLILQGACCAGAGELGVLPAIMFLLLTIVFKRLSRNFQSS